MPLYGDGRSGTFSATVTQYGGYQTPASQASTPPPANSSLISQPSPLALPETWTGPDGAPWSAQWTTGADTATGALVDINGNRGRLISTTTATSQGNYALLTGLPDTADFDITLDLAFAATTDAFFTLWARADGTGWGNYTGPANGYRLVLQPGGNAILRKTVGGTSTDLLTTVISAWTANTVRRVRFQGAGSSLSAKVWDPAGAEPGTWNAGTVTDTAITAAGKVCIKHWSGGAGGNQTAFVDNFAVATTIAAGTAASAAGSVTLGGAASAAVTATGTGLLTLGGTATSRANATASGAITLSGTVTATDWYPARAWTATDAWPGPDSTGSAAAVASGSLSLGGTVTATARTVATGVLTLSGTGSTAARAAGAGSLTLAGTGTARSSATATGVLSLAGTATAAATATATGSITLGATGTALAPTGANGALTLTGSGTTRAVATATGSLTLTGTGTGVQSGTSAAAGSIALGGTATAQAGAAATGAVTLGGTGSTTARIVAAGTVTLTGTAGPAARTSSSGGLTLASAATLSALANAAGAITLTGLATGVEPAPFGGEATPQDTLHVEPEHRAVSVAAEARGLEVVVEDRTLLVRFEPRLLPVPLGSRELVSA